MDEGQTDTSGVRFPPPLLFLLAIGLGYLLERAAPMAIAPRGALSLTRTLGAGLIGAGLALDAWAMLAFRRVGTRPEPWKATTAIATRGPYRFTRNPMYLGFALVSAGLGLILNALWIVLLVPAALAVLGKAVVAREERYLEAKFGTTYVAYKALTRRWL